MSLESQALVDAIVSHAMSLGVFERVNSHEPKNAPGRGLNVAAWVQEIGPIRGSGLKKTSVRVIFNIRVYSNMLQEPQDAIDPNLMDAVDKLMAAYTGDFQLDGLIRNVDLLGAYSGGLSAQAGYIKQDNDLYRVIVISLPLILNDVWEQVQ